MKEAFEKLKERLRELEKECLSMYDWHGQTITLDALSIVSEVEAEYGNGWIDVKDRLPEKDGYYLTCDHKGNIHVFYHHQGLKETAPFGICEHHSQYYQPIAWMELPKPYNRLERK